MVEMNVLKGVVATAEFESIILAGLGGAMAYLIIYYQGKYRDEGGRTDFVFDWVLFFIQIIIGLFAGYLVHDVVQQYEEYKDLFIALSGFLALPVLKLVQSRGAEAVFEFLFKTGKGKK